MYSGFLPKGLTEEDLSPDDDGDEQESDVDKEKEGKKTESCDEKLSSARESKASVVDAQPTSTVSDANSESPTCSLPGISQEMWQVCCFGVLAL